MQEGDLWNDPNFDQLSPEQQIALLEEKLKEVEKQNSWVDDAILHKKTYYETMNMNHEAQIKKIALNGRKQRNRAMSQYTRNSCQNRLESSSEELKAQRSASTFEHAKTVLGENFFHEKRTKAEVKVALEKMCDEKKKNLFEMRRVINNHLKPAGERIKAGLSPCVLCEKQNMQQWLQDVQMTEIT